ncbi:hypothetical protein GO728_15345 [Eggerthella lenta]|nr:hypothetical protein [Eggerthella lenta]
MGKVGKSHSASTVVFMDRFADIPRSLPEARAKLRGGLGECASFVFASPCSALCWVLGRARAAIEAMTAFIALHRGAIGLIGDLCGIAGFVLALVQLLF